MTSGSRQVIEDGMRTKLRVKNRQLSDSFETKHVHVCHGESKRKNTKKV